MILFDLRPILKIVHVRKVVQSEKKSFLVVRKKINKKSINYINTVSAPLTVDGLLDCTDDGPLLERPVHNLVPKNDIS